MSSTAEMPQSTQYFNVSSALPGVPNGAAVSSYKPSGERRWIFAVDDAAHSYVAGPLALGRDGTLFFPTCENPAGPGGFQRGACRIDAIGP